MNIAKVTLNYIVVIFLLSGLSQGKGQATQGADRILGKWMAAEKNLTVEVYKTGNEFKGRIVWFNDDPSKAMDEWRDTHNPDPALRSRKILGMDIMRGLKYNKGDDAWVDGTIYDAQHGKEWNSSAYIDENGLLHVRGFWHFKLFGKTMIFKRP